jgi:Activator of Hsp90 ATPase homolog 1-like protein
MPDILHKVAVKASPNDTAKALTTLPGLAGWWTTDTQGNSTAGGVIEFRFGTHGRIDMKVLELDSGRRVLWEVVRGPEVWAGTKVSFELRQEDDFTVILFKHQGWKEPSEFMHHCSTKWAMFLMSMKSLVETGKGAPYPNDVHIANKGD